MRRLSSCIAFGLVPIWLFICPQSLSQIPKKALISEPEKITPDMRVSTDDGKDVSPEEKRELDRYRDALSISAEGSYTTLKFINPGGLSFKAKSFNGTTIYRFPCSGEISGSAEAFIEWENTTKRACEKGIRVKSRKKTSKMSIDKTLNKMALLNEIIKEDRRYYCSALPDDGSKGGGMSMGETSIDDSCSRAIKQCSSKDNVNKSNCSLQTMGEWSIKDSKLMMSITCDNKELPPIKVNSSDLLWIALANQLLNVGNNSTGCFLDMHQPDEIIISPEKNDETTSVKVTGENDRIKVEVISGNAKLRSIEQLNGIIAKEGDTYSLNGEGSIEKSRGRQSTVGPTDQTPNTPPSSTPIK